MTWALAKVTKFFAICMSLRNSLKVLKNVSVCEDDDAISESAKRKHIEQCSGILMFWTIFGVTVVCEQYFEFLVRWFPLYYYAKAFFILFKAFPRLRFTEYVFYKLLVPAVEYVHQNVGNISAMPPGDVLLLLSFQVVFICFPMINHDIAEESDAVVDLSTSEILLLDSDNEEEGIDLDVMLEEDKEVDLDEILSYEKTILYQDDAETDPSKECAIVDYDADIKMSVENREYNIDVNSLFSGRDSVSRGSASQYTISGYDIPNNTRKESDIGEENFDPQFRSPSRFLQSCRKLLNGDSRTRLSECVFNLDLHSPPPNSQYRRRQSYGQSELDEKERSSNASSHNRALDDKMPQDKCSHYNLRRKSTTDFKRDFSVRNGLASHLRGSNEEGDIKFEDRLDIISASKETKSNVTLRRRRGNRLADDSEASDVKYASKNTTGASARCKSEKGDTVESFSLHSTKDALSGLRRSRCVPTIKKSDEKVKQKTTWKYV